MHLLISVSPLAQQQAWVSTMLRKTLASKNGSLSGFINVCLIDLAGFCFFFWLNGLNGGLIFSDILKIWQLILIIQLSTQLTVCLDPLSGLTLCLWLNELGGYLNIWDFLKYIFKFLFQQIIRLSSEFFSISAKSKNDLVDLLYLTEK